MASYWTHWRRVRREMKQVDQDFTNRLEDENLQDDVSFNDASVNDNHAISDGNFHNVADEQFSNDSDEDQVPGDIAEIFEAYGEPDSLRDDLGTWASKNNVPRDAVNKLLKILIRHGCDLPKDNRTLVSSTQNADFNIEEKCGGQYIYFGLVKSITSIFSTKLPKENEILVNVNIDGLPLFKSSPGQLWPILCFLNNHVLTIALYYGTKKPDPVEVYLKDFLQEVEQLQREGLHLNGKKFKFFIRAFICDAPARCFLKGIIGHTGYHSCERCVVDGRRFENRTVFGFARKEPRTDEKFANMEYLGLHQTKPSPLLQINFPCVSGFCLDYMHLVCLGAMRRILSFLRSGPRVCRLSQQQINEVSNRLIALNGELPSEFVRQPRSLAELDRWKATELRQFLLYTGPIVLKSIVSSDTYDHFLCLSVAISILLNSSSEVRSRLKNYARELLTHFVQYASDIYGDTFRVYNIHCLLHLVDDLNFGCSLNEVSAFPFENHLQKFKRCVKNGNNPLFQISKRISLLNENMFNNSLYAKISVRGRDNCFIIENHTVIFVTSVSDTRIECDCFKMEHLENLFIEPEESKIFSIAYLPSHIKGRKRNHLTTEITRKMVALPFRQGLALFPMLHEIER